MTGKGDQLTCRHGRHGWGTLYTVGEVAFLNHSKQFFLLLVQKTFLTNELGVTQKRLPEMAADSLTFNNSVTYLEAHIKAKHEKMYSEEKSNKCHFASAQAGNLKDHLKTHSGEKTNKCNQCQYASFYASHLRTHLKTHSGERANKCNQCEYASSQASHLRTHLKTHSGEKTNKCNQCEYASSQASNLRTHMYI